MKYLSQLKIASCFLLGLLFTLFTLTTQVNANITQLPFYWDAIDVAIDVQDNGDMLVTETQTYVFNREHPNERYRYIPQGKVDKITDITVSENNSIIPSQVGRENDRLWIKWQHELNAPESHTFVIKYRVVGGLRVDSHRAQVYWKAIFSDRSAPIQNAKVTVRLPSLAEKIYSYNYYPDNISASARQLDRQTVEFIAQKPISAGQELEVKVAFPNNVLNLPKPEWQQSKASQTKRFDRNNDFPVAVTNFFNLFFGVMAVLLVPLIFAALFLSAGKSSSRSRSYSSGGFSGGGFGGGGGSAGGGSGGGGGGGGG